MKRSCEIFGLARKLHEDTGWMCVWRVRGRPFGAQSIAIAMVCVKRGAIGRGRRTDTGRAFE